MWFWQPCPASSPPTHPMRRGRRSETGSEVGPGERAHGERYSHLRCALIGVAAGRLHREEKYYPHKAENDRQTSGGGGEKRFETRCVLAQQNGNQTLLLPGNHHHSSATAALPGCHGSDRRKILIGQNK